MLETIMMKDLDKLNKPFIIDIRKQEEYALGHLPQAINIPMCSLLNSPYDYLQKNVKYYLYCQTGSRSKKTCSFLSLLGYDVVDIMDGYNGWLKLK